MEKSFLTNIYCILIRFFAKIAPILGGYDPADYYFVGALIALSCAIFSAANNIVIALVKQTYCLMFSEYNQCLA